MIVKPTNDDIGKICFHTDPDTREITETALILAIEADAIRVLDGEKIGIIDMNWFLDEWKVKG